MNVLPALESSWRRAWIALGSDRHDAALLQRLATCYQEPQRRYHTLQHLLECITHLEEAAGLATAPGEVEIALWFHDAIYDVRGHDNELRSAAWAETEIVAGGVAAPAAARVRELVLATQHAAPAPSPDAALLVDIDLSILGAPAGRFDEYETQIRQEYAWVPDEQFRSKRREVLAGFLVRSTIYATEHFRRRLEAAARANLRRSLERLEG